jgi:hypothetical protein
VQECKELCDKDDYCDMGYHLELNGKRVCVPIRTTYQWANTTPLFSLISSVNDTRLSTDRKNVKYTGFYNEKRFPSFSELPSDFFTHFIFSGMRVSLKRFDSSSLSLMEDFTFDPYQKLIFIVKSRYTTFYDFTVRIGFRHIISIRRDDSFLELASLSDESDRLRWVRHYSDEVKSSWVFERANDDDEFVDSGTPFYLRENDGKKRFLFVDDTGRLALSGDQKTIFCFIVDETNAFNQYRKQQFEFAEDVNHADNIKPVFTHTLTDYLAQQYSCYDDLNGKNDVFVLPILTAVVLLLLIRLLQLIKRGWKQKIE